MLAGSFSPATGLEIGADPFPGSLRVLWELSGAGVDDGLDLLFRLFRNGDVTVKIFIHKQSDEHLEIMLAEII